MHFKESFFSISPLLAPEYPHGMLVTVFSSSEILEVTVLASLRHQAKNLSWDIFPSYNLAAFVLLTWKI